MNSSRKGVVLFSLGSFLRSDMLPQPMLKSILTAFEQMPNYNFLWKFETDTLPTELPKNVFVQSWLPQNDILAHPRTKAFISHGGLMSTIEASWHGVPIIGIPIVADQHRVRDNFLINYRLFLKVFSFFLAEHSQIRVGWCCG